jgi:hypothetical protein
MTSLTLPKNARPAIRQRVERGRVTVAAPLAMVFARTLLFAAFQALIALLLALTGSAAPWQASVAWWPASVVASNLTTLVLLNILARREGVRLIDLYSGERGHFWTDLLIALALLLIGGPLGYFPNPLLATPLLGSPEAALDMFVRPLPLWAAVVFGVLFPLTIPFVELPTYFGYCMPRLQVLFKNRWTGMLLPALMLAAQHIALPLIFDVRFVTWRLLMFLPFALFIGIVLSWRPRLLPYMMVIHGLMDISLVYYIVLRAAG